MTQPSQLHHLRAHAIAHSLFPPTTLQAAIARMGFVQADPIRSPARAQDLILRHRVENYIVGDLDRQYCGLDLEEDFLYAYGFLSREVWAMVHPRAKTPLSTLEQKILEAVGKSDSLHPSTLATDFGRKRVVNAWGGYSHATKRALERLHYRGLLRIARREKGIRIYQAARLPVEPFAPQQRLSRLIMVVANILAPVPAATLQSIASRLRRLIPVAGDHRVVLCDLYRSGELEKQVIQDLAYAWPTPGTNITELPRQVRILAPFDPLVWDRQRFEHIWQWQYRFEAYTPPAKRVRGYYAMPLLWGDRIIGWANVEAQGRTLDVQCGFVEKRPRDRSFKSELDAEIARIETFLSMNGSPAERLPVSRIDPAAS
jgi:uncharacterized protein YcaQ